MFTWISTTKLQYIIEKIKAAVTHDLSGKADKATTLSGYGITDAKIASGTITLGSNTITPITDISGKQDKLTTQTAYSAKGSATKVPQITTNSLGQVTGITEVTITQPTVNNGTLTIQKNGTNVQTFTANQSSSVTANITVPTKTSELTNDSSYITSSYHDSTKADTSSLATVATSGKYSDLTGTPTIPTVNNATLTIQKNGTNVKTFTANASADVTANITVPTKTSELTNDSGYKTTDTTYTAGTNVSISSSNVISATDTTYSDMTGATSSAAGTHGLVPAPAAGNQAKFLRGDGTWQTPATGSGTVTSVAVKMNGSVVNTITTSGTIDLGTVITAHQDISGKMDKSNPTGTGYFSLNRKSGTTVGDYSFAEGYSPTASGQASHAEGGATTASGYAAHAEGSSTTASGNACHTEGFMTTASGVYAHAEGSSTTASSSDSHAEGHSTTASAPQSHAEGYGTTASKNFSHSEGFYTLASSKYQHVQGQYNVEDTEGTYAHIVGNGTSTSARSNAHTLDWSGNAWFAGDVTDGSGNVLSNLGSIKFQNDSGTGQYSLDGGTTWKNFRNPTGNATVYDVLKSKVFSNASGEDLIGMLGVEKQTVSLDVPAGMSTGQTIYASTHSLMSEVAITAQGPTIEDVSVTSGTTTQTVTPETSGNVFDSITVNPVTLNDMTWSKQTVTCKATNGASKTNSISTKAATAVQLGTGNPTSDNTTTVIASGSRLYFTGAVTVPQVGIYNRAIRTSTSGTYAYGGTFTLVAGVYETTIWYVNINSTATTAATCAIGTGSEDAWTTVKTFINGDFAVNSQRYGSCCDRITWTNSSTRTCLWRAKSTGGIGYFIATLVRIK